MQAPPSFTSTQRKRRVQNKYCKNSNNNKMPQWTKNCKRLFRKSRPTAVDNKGAQMFGITVSDIFYVLEHVCFSSLWLESTQVIVYANVGMRTTGILLFC